MLLAFAPNTQNHDLHNGTSFDYLWVLRKYPKGHTIRNKILEYFLEGLLRLIDDIEKGRLPATLSITGSSYFFSVQTAERLGFSLTSPSLFDRFNLFMNYLDLCWMYSLSKGKWAFPKMSAVKKVRIEGKDLVTQKDKLKGLHAYLKSRNEIFHLT